MSSESDRGSCFRVSFVVSVCLARTREKEGLLWESFAFCRRLVKLLLASRGNTQLKWNVTGGEGLHIPHNTENEYRPQIVLHSHLSAFAI